MKQLTRTTRYILYALGAIAVVGIVVGLVINGLFYSFTTPLQWILGLLLGIVTSGIRMVLLERATKQSMQKEGEAAKNYAQVQFLLRFVLSIIVLVVLFLFPQWFNLIGGIIGILSLQFAAYLAKWMLHRAGYPED